RTGQAFSPRSRRAFRRSSRLPAALPALSLDGPRQVLAPHRRLGPAARGAASEVVPRALQRFEGVHRPVVLLLVAQLISPRMPHLEKEAPPGSGGHETTGRRLAQLRPRLN